MRPVPTPRRPSWARSVVAVLRRPHLRATTLVVVRRLAPTGWWGRPPHLPLPDPDYWAFRSTTAFGHADAVPDPDDVVAYLEWCRAWPEVVGRRS